MKPNKLGERDGRDAFLINKSFKNPFKWGSDENKIYHATFNKAYQEEETKSFSYEMESTDRVD